ncbi:MAG: hypothetical protein MK008_05890 [Bdellovibrionales bacterium]|nr:hypothetical protein [Bdellovibrionales bacterium]
MINKKFINSTKRIIFHYPLSIDKYGKSGSTLRPYKMIKAFEDCGYFVDVVSGDVNSRKEAIRTIKNNFKKGIRYDFLYSESTTMPTLLCEKNHIPKSPLLDYLFWFWFKRNCGPVGLFYRDIYWRFNDYKSNLNFLKRTYAKFFYWADLVAYRLIVNVVFLPSNLMISYIPKFIRPKSYHSLPPGCDLKETKDKKDKKDLRLLYIGSIAPPYYNIKPLLEVMSRSEFAKLIICCPKDQWVKYSHLYDETINNNINIVHESNKNLDKLYEESDFVVVFRENNEYLKFSMPYKIFEAIGYNKPIIINKDCEAGRYINYYRIGATVSSGEELYNLLLKINNERSIIDQYIVNIKNNKNKFTWQARALEAKNKLMENNENSHFRT